MSLFDLSNKTILITGGYGHLGRAMTRGLADFDAQVCVLARSRDKFDATFDEGSANIDFIECDIAETASIRDAFATAVDRHGSLDGLINNALYFKGSDPLAISDQDWRYGIDGSLDSVYRCIREAAPYFKQQNSGNIINMASMYGMVSPHFSVYEDAPESLNPPHYGAAKAALIQLTKYFAQYLGPWNVRVNSISPGPFPNPKVQQNARFITALEQRTIAGRIGQPEDLVGAAVYLSSSASSYVTGHNLVVDGGWTVS